MSAEAGSAVDESLEVLGVAGSKVFDLTLPLDQAAEATKPWDRGRVIKTCCADKSDQVRRTAF